ncbi:hypothetical protein D3C87_1502520 [compost metagenome]
MPAAFAPRSVRPARAASRPSKAPGAAMNQLPMTSGVAVAPGFSMAMTAARSRRPDSWALPIISAIERAVEEASVILPLTLATAPSLRAWA